MRSAPVNALTILVIDDDSDLIRTLADILRLHGYSPETAATGWEGLQLAERCSPALAIVDLRLPDMDGVELVAKLHALSERMEVVVLTGNATVDSAIAALRQNSVDYLVKPVQVDRLLAVASVATERWQRRDAEDRLRESDERFRRVVDSNMLGIMFWKASGQIYDANDAFLNMVGYTREELGEGLLVSSRITPSEFEAIDREMMANVAVLGTIAPYEKAYRRKDGARVPVLIGAATLEGRTDRGVCFVLDITERKSAALALEARARQQEAVAHFGHRAFGATDLPKLFDEAVALVAEILDLPFCSILERRADGNALDFRAGVGFEDMGRPVVVSIVDSAQGGHTVLADESVIVNDYATDTRFPDTHLQRKLGVQSGVTVPIPGLVHPFGVLAAFDDRAREYTPAEVHFLEAMAHFVSTAVERHRSDLAGRQSQRLEAVGRLASSVAHDFNNMLTVISAFGQLVHDGLPGDDALRVDVDEILKAAERAANLTRQLLAFSRQQVLQPKKVLLNDIVIDMEPMIRQLAGKSVELSLTLAPDLAYIMADPTQLEQVILNLCVNARDAMPNGGRIAVATLNVHVDAAQAIEHSIERVGDYVSLVVSDTGQGMDAETKGRIFEPFFTTKGPEKGTGLGLATVYGIVKQSRGELSVHSEVGRGTEFRIFLPTLGA
ncbi:MAG: two-component hybrid sensor and regulator [Gemmatimonadetes bacterium]|jgi:two-component system cell cycle sensor histidine kinase/response regulator CckA|nr:two-component hybrid sensor and regulator [Gemmatimonadota bacterium]